MTNYSSGQYNESTGLAETTFDQRQEAGTSFDVRKPDGKIKSIKRASVDSKIDKIERSVSFGSTLPAEVHPKTQLTGEMFKTQPLDQPDMPTEDYDETPVRTGMRHDILNRPHPAQPNHAKIRHSNYFVDVPYAANPHKGELVHPRGFPLRQDTDYVKANKRSQVRHLSQPETKKRVKSHPHSQAPTNGSARRSKA